MSFIYETCINFRLITPEKEVFPGSRGSRAPVVWVDIPGVEGNFGVLPAHAPLVATIRPGILTVDPYAPQLKEEFVVIGGYVEVRHRKKEEKSPNVKEDEEWATDVTVLADRAVARENFDTGTLANEIKDTEEDVADATDEAQRDKLTRHLEQLKALQAALGAAASTAH